MADAAASSLQEADTADPDANAAHDAAANLESAHIERHQWLCDNPVRSILIKKTRLCTVSEGKLRDLDDTRLRENIRSVRTNPPLAPINIAVIANKGIPCARIFFPW